MKKYIKTLVPITFVALTSVACSNKQTLEDSIVSSKAILSLNEAHEVISINTNDIIDDIMFSISNEVLSGYVINNSEAIKKRITSSDTWTLEYQDITIIIKIENNYAEMEQNVEPNVFVSFTDVEGEFNDENLREAAIESVSLHFFDATIDRSLYSEMKNMAQLYSESLITLGDATENILNLSEKYSEKNNLLDLERILNDKIFYTNELSSFRDGPNSSMSLGTIDEFDVMFDKKYALYFQELFQSYKGATIGFDSTSAVFWENIWDDNYLTISFNIKSGNIEHIVQSRLLFMPEKFGRIQTYFNSVSNSLEVTKSANEFINTIAIPPNYGQNLSYITNHFGITVDIYENIVVREQFDENIIITNVYSRWDEIDGYTINMKIVDIENERNMWLSYPVAFI